MFFGLFLWNYLGFLQLDIALLNSLDYYTPIAGTVLLVLFSLKRKKSSRLFVAGILYSIFVIALQFGLKEVVYPKIKTVPYITTSNIDAPYNIASMEFEDMEFLPQKNGMILQDSEVSFVFGTIAQQNPSSYIVKNAFFKDHSGNALFAEHAKIVNNQIILYDSSNQKNTNHAPKNYLLPLPFDMESSFNVWGVTDPKHIELIPILMNSSLSQSLAIILALSQYLLSFILLFIVGILAASLRGQLQFDNLQILGAFVAITCSYPFVLLIYYYLSLVIQLFLNHTIKI